MSVTAASDLNARSDLASAATDGAIRASDTSLSSGDIIDKVAESRLEYALYCKRSAQSLLDSVESLQKKLVAVNHLLSRVSSLMDRCKDEKTEIGTADLGLSDLDLSILKECGCEVKGSMLRPELNKITIKLSDLTDSLTLEIRSSMLSVQENMRQSSLFMRSAEKAASESETDLREMVKNLARKHL